VWDCTVLYLQRDPSHPRHVHAIAFRAHSRTQLVQKTHLCTSLRNGFGMMTRGKVKVKITPLSLSLSLSLTHATQ